MLVRRILYFFKYFLMCRNSPRGHNRFLPVHERHESHEPAVSWSMVREILIRVIRSLPFCSPVSVFTIFAEPI